MTGKGNTVREAIAAELFGEIDALVLRLENTARIVQSHEENESRSQEECKQAKSASCKGRGFNKESESENHRMEELLFHQEKRKVDEGSRLVHYLHFYKMV